MAKRVTARIPDDIAVKVATWAERLGVTQAQLMGMAIQAGLDSIIRAVSPVDALAPEKWAQIFAAMEDQGLDVTNLKKNVKEGQNETANRNESTK